MPARWPAAYLCVAAGACFSPSPPAGVPCGPDFTCPGDQTCDIVTNTCGPPSEALVWRDDTALDFGTAGAYVSEVAIEKQGFVGPAGFLFGGVRLTGYAGLLVPDAATTFEDIAANTPTGVSIAHDLRIDFGQSTPWGLGLPGGDNITVTVEGEIEIAAPGASRFRLTANDRGFFEIETAPGSGTFTRLIDDDDATTIATFDAPVVGWYRYRGAFQDAGGFFDYRLEIDPININGNGFFDIPTERMRVRADDLEGLVVDGFDFGFMMSHVGTVLDGTPPADVTLNQPFGLPIGVGDLTVRWNGQFLIETPGDYTFRLATREGHRMWIDGALVANAFTTTSETTVTPPITLDAGWHDLVMDVTKDSGNGAGSSAITIESGPEAGLVGSWFPADRLRPIAGRVARFLSAQSDANVTIPDGADPLAPLSRDLDLDLPPNITAIDVRVLFAIAHDLPSSVELVLDPPGGGNTVTVAAFGDLNDAEPEPVLYLPQPTANAGQNWTFRATDNAADGITGAITDLAVTIVYDGGPAPFPTTYRYESAVRELGDVVAFERVAWVLRQAPDPALVTVRLRTCDSADACASETYADVKSGEAPGVVPRRFAQYEVVFQSTGDLPTALDTFELRYFVRGAE